MTRPGPKRTPAALRIAYSQPSAHPVHDEVVAPPVTEAPDPPAWLIGAGRAEWERIVPLMMEVGLLANLDLNTLASYCECVRVVVDANAILNRSRRRKGQIDGRLVVTSPNGAPYLNPLHAAKMAAMRDMSRYAQTLGLTPSARASLSLGGQGGAGPVGKPATANRDAGLASKYKL